MTVRQVGSRADRGVHLVRLECVCRQLTLSGQSASDCAGEKSDNIATRHQNTRNSQHLGTSIANTYLAWGLYRTVNRPGWCCVRVVVVVGGPEQAEIQSTVEDVSVECQSESGVSVEHNTRQVVTDTAQQGTPHHYHGSDQTPYVTLVFQVPVTPDINSLPSGLQFA